MGAYKRCALDHDLPVVESGFRFITGPFHLATAVDIHSSRLRLQPAEKWLIRLYKLPTSQCANEVSYLALERTRPD